MAGPGEQRRHAIEAALLEFECAPQRHAIARREPAVLFDAIREVLLLADERGIQEGGGPPPSSALVQAARFFVRKALLRAQASHYALLGLPASAEVAAVKERYRLMMRLLHPDFASQSLSAHWPADAASRLNLAYEVLSSPERKQSYDAELAPRPAPSPPPSRTVAMRPSQAAQAAVVRDPRRVLRGLAMGFGAAGGLAALAMWGTTGDREWLVQRAVTRPPARIAQTSTDTAPPLPAASVATRESASPAASPADPRALSEALIAALPSFLNTSASRTAAEPAPAPVAAVNIAPTIATSAPPPTMLALVTPVATATAAPVPERRVETPAPPPAVRLPAAVVAQAAPPPAAPARPAASSSGPSVAEAQDFLMRLVSEIETGWGDNVIASLEPALRRSAGAQALARQLDALCEGARPVQVARVEFHGEPRDGRLAVTGDVMLRVRDATVRPLSINAEFARVDGALVLTRIEPAPH